MRDMRQDQIVPQNSDFQRNEKQHEGIYEINNLKVSPS